MPADLAGGRPRIVIGAPDGDLTSNIRPVEAMIDENGINLRIGLDVGDLEKLQERPFIWLSLATDRLPVFSIRTEADSFVWPDEGEGAAQ